MKIISFLRTTPDEKMLKKVSYHAKECSEFVEDGNFISSSDALASHNKKAKFLFLGSKNEIDSIQKRFSFPIDNLDYECIEISNDYNEIFKIILGNLDSKHTIIDITHGDRDTSFIAPLASLLNDNVKDSKFTLVHAKPKKNANNEFEFINLNEYAEIMKFSFILISFKQFIKVPELNLNDLLYETLKEFSDDFLANRIYKCAKDFSKLRSELNSAKETNLSFLANFIDEILKEWSDFFSSLNGKKDYEIYFLVSKFLFSKNYLLNSSQFLIEAIPKYVFEYIKQYMQTGNSDKSITDLCNSFLSNGELKNKDCEIKPPYRYFYDLNIEIFNQLNKFRDKIGTIRHNLTHISNAQLGEIGLELKKYIDEYEALILKENILEKLDFKGKDQNKLIIYKYNIFKNKMNDLAQTNFNQAFSNKLCDFYNAEIKKKTTKNKNISIEEKRLKKVLNDYKKEAILIYKNYKRLKEDNEKFFKDDL